MSSPCTVPQKTGWPYRADFHAGVRKYNCPQLPTYIATAVSHCTFTTIDAKSTSYSKARPRATGCPPQWLVGRLSALAKQACAKESHTRRLYKERATQALQSVACDPHVVPSSGYDLPSLPVLGLYTCKRMSSSTLYCSLCIASPTLRI